MSNSFRILLTLAMLSALGCESSTLHSQLRHELNSNNSDAANAQSQIPDLSTIATSTAVSEPFISVVLPNRDRPVSAAMSCQIVSDHDDSTVVEVWIKVKIARGHYVYASGKTKGHAQKDERTYTAFRDKTKGRDRSPIRAPNEF